MSYKIDPKLKNAVTAAYELGKQDGAAKLQRQLDCMLTANQHLMESLSMLDVSDPLDGVVINKKLLDSIIGLFTLYIEPNGTADCKKCPKFKRSKYYKKILIQLRDQIDARLNKVYAAFGYELGTFYEDEHT